MITQFREELTRLVLEVETSVAAGHLDLNKICEDVFCGIFRELYGLSGLRNINSAERANFPAIDLADEEARIAIQVTSDPSLAKVKSTLNKFIKHDLHKKFDRLIVYVITRKQNQYSAASIQRLCGDKFQFNPTSDVLDFRDLATVGATRPPRALKKALDALLSYTQSCAVGLGEKDFDPPEDPPELLTSNLLECYFPSKLFIAPISPDVFGTRSPRNQRKAVGKFVRQNHASVPSDYEVNSGRIITFHDLESSSNPFSMLIEEGAAEAIAPSDYYEIDDDHERVFKSLLRFSLQQKLYRHRVLWKHLDGLFIFLPVEDTDNERTEHWFGEKHSSRTVFQRYFKKNNPEKVLSTRHFAFSVSFLIVAGDWHLAITPDWFFSYGNEYRRSNYSDGLLSGKKKLEKNSSVRGHFRFLSTWLRELDAEDLFSAGESIPALSFGDTLEFGGGRYLEEALWEPLVVTDEADTPQQNLELR